MITLAGLRGLQTHNDGRLDGNLNWVPYVFALVLLALLILLAVSRIKVKRGNR